MIKRILSTSFHSVISRFFITVTNLFIIFFVSKNFTRVELGSYGIVFFFFILFVNISSMNLYLFFSKEIARYKKKSSEELVLINELIVVSIFGIILTFLLPVVFSLFYKKITLSLLMLSSIAGYFQGVERNLGGLLLGKEKMPIESLVNFIMFFLVAVPMLLLKNSFNSIEMIFSLRIFVFIVAIIIKIWFLKEHFKKIKLNLKLKLFKEAKYYWFASLTNVALREIDILILSFFIDKSLLGGYFLALRIFYSFAILAEVVSTGLTPYISKFYNNRKNGKFNKFTEYLFMVFLFFAFVFSISLFLGRKLIVSIFSPEFLADAGTYLMFFSFILFFRFLSFFTGAILTSSDAQKIRFNIMLIAAFIMIILEILLGPQLKVSGILIARMIMELYLFFAFGYFVKKIISNANLIGDI